MMGFADKYIEKSQGKYFYGSDTDLSLEIIVVIPCYDEPDISKTIHSLFQCDGAGIQAGVVVVINSSEDSPERVKYQNELTFIELEQLSLISPEWMHLYVLNVKDLPSKNAGVGWARKIGMDWAISIFNKSNYPGGIIVSLDADALVEKNYLKSIIDYYKENPKKVGATIYFEHPLNGGVTDYSVILYELYMRYFRNAMALTGFPNSIYTVGSCFTVIASAYIAQGGMNRKKAGEDFYFLHKLAPYGEMGEIRTTAVYPSSRISDRVPFGTGQMINRYFSGEEGQIYTYPIEAFMILKNFFINKDIYYEKGKSIVNEDISDNNLFIEFLELSRMSEKIIELVLNCSNINVFRKRFFHIFDALIILKWLNFATVNSMPKSNLIEECHKLFRFKGVNINITGKDDFGLLKFLREKDKQE